MELKTHERLAIWIIGAWLSSLRPSVEYSQEFSERLKEKRPFIVACWHRDLIYVLYHFRLMRGAAMVSGSRDGELVAKALSYWGKWSIRGSRHKGGKRAIFDMAEIMKEKGLSGGIIADGSQGPAEKAQLGPLVLSRLTQMPVFPIGVHVKRAKYLNTWDRLVIPYPFSKVSVVVGKPILVPEDAKGILIQEYRKELEVGLNRVFDMAKMSI